MQQGLSQIRGDPLAIGQMLSGPALLGAWENGTGKSPPARALILLCAGCPALTPEDAATLPLTVRDQALVRLHTHSFGPTLSAIATCGSCHERLEFVLSAQQVAQTLRAAQATHTVTQDSVSLRLRLANTRDVMDAAAEQDLAAARLLLLARCAEAVDAGGQIVPLPESLRDAVLEQLDVMHEAAEITLTLACPTCDARQGVHFDIASFLWAKIRQAAQRLLDEVHELAWAYGWSEASILAMNVARRQAYLERVRA